MSIDYTGHTDQQISKVQEARKISIAEEIESIANHMKINPNDWMSAQNKNIKALRSLIDEYSDLNMDRMTNKYM